MNRAASTRHVRSSAGALALAAAFIVLGVPSVPRASPPAACCSDPAHFPYQPLPARGSIDFRIDTHGPEFEFQTGVSTFHAFALPAAERPYLIELRSFVDGGPDPRAARVFYPIVAVLTDDFVVSRLTDLEHLRYDLPLFELTTAPAYRVVLPFDPANHRERYLVVFTAAQLVGKRELPPIANPETAAEVAKIAFLGATSHGRLRITVRDEELPPVAPALTEPAPAH
jgi:hypothetical protein